MKSKNAILALVICMMLLLVYLPTFVSGDIDTNIAEGYYGGDNNNRVLARTSNGTLYAVYTDLNNQNVLCSISTDEGVTWTETTLIQATYNAYEPTIAIDSNDVVYVFWKEWNTTNQIKYCIHNGSWSGAEFFTNEANDSIYLAIAVNSTNYVHVVWGYETGDGGQITELREGWFNYYIDIISTPEIITSGHPENPAIAIDENDIIHVAWSEYIYQETDISFLIKYSYNDGYWSQIYNVTEFDSLRECKYPSIVVDGSTVHIAWKDTLWDIYDEIVNVTYEYRSFNGTWGDKKNIYTYDNVAEGQYISLSRDATQLYAIFDGQDYRGIICLLYSTYDGDTWSSENFIKYTDYPAKPNTIFAQYPIISNAETNIPETGFAFIYENITDILQGNYVSYYSNVTWQQEEPEYGDNTTFPDAKMHFPQYPDPLGWDIFSRGSYLADDWLCTQSGNVTDIHFWVSSYNDTMGYDEILEYVTELSIIVFSNIPSPPYSKPGDILWYLGLGTYNVNLAGPFYGDEGWMEPNGSYYDEHNHQLFWRVDVNIMQDQFYQEYGTIYWFAIQLPEEYYPFVFGLKTSTDHFMDTAVYEDPSEIDWTPLQDPVTQEPLAIAFVITGEMEEFGDNTTFPNAKMTNPQYPDPYGWDADWYEYWHDQGEGSTGLADDWTCNETGYITDIHFWVSSYNDTLGYEDIYELLTNYSGHPGLSLEIWDSGLQNSLWSWGYEDTGNITVSGPYYGDEGWLIGGLNETHNHELFWRVDVTNFTNTPGGPPSSFYQVNGTTYWLVITIPYSISVHQIGWKTSDDHYGEYARYFGDSWQAFENPQIDFAFVITGEPLEYGDPTTFPNAKMHFPQYPDPYGWDVDFANLPNCIQLADDWMCNETGYVTDVHYWLSSFEDVLNTEDILGLPFDVTIMDDLNGEPNDTIWDMTEKTFDIGISGPYYGDEGWYNPDKGIYYEHNHELFYRVDITNISEPFLQINGTIYWLRLFYWGMSDFELGWKTSTDHFMENAVYFNTSYISLEDPLTQEPIDFAFVITGEPVPEFGDPIQFPNAKMHFPQYPDPYGWDVSGQLLADDWRCIQSGNVTDIHLWVSSLGDTWEGLTNEEIRDDLYLNGITIDIYTNNPGPPYSQPGDWLYEAFSDTYHPEGFDINVSGPFYGDEGWLNAPDDYAEHDHELFWRIDLTNFFVPFYQEYGTIYWLSIWSIANAGWKTSQDHFMDDAVYGIYDNGFYWYPLEDPLTNESLDLAFVITGEPLPFGDNTTFPDAKMTNPQYPDPYGWDIEFDNILADDWMCDETGNVTDIHFWVSSYEDMLSYQDIVSILATSSFNIMSDVPGPPYSQPGDTLWTSSEISFDMNLSGLYYGDEGWYAPEQDYYEHNHELFWRVDLTNFSMPFYQINGTIYWFMIGVAEPCPLGWKTSDSHFMDDAVYLLTDTFYPLEDPLTYESIDLAFVITGESIPPPPEYGDNTTFPSAKMHFPQYPDPYGWDVSLHQPLRDDWMCTETGNVTDIHFWVSAYDDALNVSEIEGMLLSNLVFGFYGYPDGGIIWSPTNYDLNVTGPFYGDEGWLVPPDAYEEHNHQQFWRVDITNISDPFLQTNGTTYWFAMRVLSIDEYTLGWKTSQNHFEEFAEYNNGAWLPLEDPLTQDPIDFAFVITGEQPLPPTSFNTTYYVNTSFNSGTPGWHITHWDNIHEAVENCTNSLYNYTVLVDGNGNIYNENVLVGTAESYNTLSIVGNYTTTRPRVNGQGATKSAFELVNDRIYVSGFEIHNSVGMATYHGISIGKTLAITQDQNNITITDCYITQANYGILLRGKYFNVSNNEIDGTTEGIYIFGPSGDNAFSTYYGNYIHGCQDGLVAYLSCNNTILRNTISGSTIYGMDLQTSSNYNTVFYNNISTSGTSCIRVRFSAYNLIYNNNFITNYPTIQGTAVNFWNMSYPICGNYYSLLGGNDNYKGLNQNIPGSDGIRDTQYTIATNNTDYYPFISPFDGTYPSLGYSYITSEQPANNSEYVLVESDMSVMVGDENSENVDVYFFWANGTLINSVNNVPSNSVVSFKILDYYTMSHDTSYSWYVTFVNSTGGMTSPTWTFTTCRAYDLNGDGIINYLDVSSLVSHYGDTIPQDIQETFLRPIGDGLATWTRSPPAPANFLLVMETIPDDPMTFVWANPPAGSPELYLIGTPSYTYSIINVTLNARMCSVAGGDLFQHCIWDGFGAPSYGPPMPTLTMFPIFQTYSFTWSSDPYGGDWTWAKLQIYHFGVDQTGVPFMSPTMMTQFYLDVYYTVPGSEPWDINSDGIVNYLDVSSLVSHYDESY